MKKKIFALLVSFLLFFTILSVYADGENIRLIDNAGLLYDYESEEILAKLDDVSERQGMDIVIFTTDAVREGFTVEEDATETYEALGFSEDGVMLYISMGERDWYLLTSGFGIIALTDAGIDYISEEFLSYLSYDDYSGAFDTFISYTDEFITQAKTGTPYDVGNMPEEPYSFFGSLIVSLGIGFIVAFIVTGIWKSSLKSVARKTRATNYIKHGSLDITDARELFLYRTVDRRARPKNQSSGGGSTTHTSSSGRSYGGRGGKF